MMRDDIQLDHHCRYTLLREPFRSTLETFQKVAKGYGTNSIVGGICPCIVSALG